jgi:hypothetical protein
MKNSTPFFAGFHLQSLRRPARSLQQKISDERDWMARRTFRQIGELCGKFIPSKSLDPSAEGDFSRNRIYSKTNVFWALFSQVLSPDGGCKEVVKKIQSYSSERGLEIPSSSTASYCAARNKLPQEILDEVIEETAKHLDRLSDMYSFHNRRVVVVDGTGFRCGTRSTPPATKGLLENETDWQIRTACPPSHVDAPAPVRRSLIPGLT